MALQVCKTCGTRYAPAAVCPHCGGELWISELEADEQQPAQAAVPAAAVVPPAGDDAPPDYATYPMAILRDLARERGITQHGAKKEDLAAALAQWDFEHPAGDDPEDAGPDDAPEGG